MSKENVEKTGTFYLGRFLIYNGFKDQQKSFFNNFSVAPTEFSIEVPFSLYQN